MQDVRGNTLAKYSGRANGIKFVRKDRNVLESRQMTPLRQVYSKMKKKKNSSFLLRSLIDPSFTISQL